MDVVKVPLLTADRPVSDAIREASRAGVLIQQGSEIRLAKPSQLRRIQQQSGAALLRDLGPEYTEAVYHLRSKEAERGAVSISGGVCSGDLESVLGGRRMAMFQSDLTYLISACEDHLVDYHCQRNLHSWSPPPAWVDGVTKCFCKSLIVRE